MNTRAWADGARRRVVSLLGVCMLCGWGHIGVSEGVAQTTPKGVGIAVTTEPAEKPGAPTVYRLSLTGDPRETGPVGAFYRTTRPISHARVIEVDPPTGRVIPQGSNPRTQIALWNELGTNGKLTPYQAVRHGGSSSTLAEGGYELLGNWDDFNRDGLPDLGFIYIGYIDQRIMLRYAEFNPVPVSGWTQSGGKGSSAPQPELPENEPWSVALPVVPPGFSAADVPARDEDGDGVPDPTGFDGGGCHIYIVQFVAKPLNELRDAITSAGVDILRYMPHNGYIVRASADAIEVVRSLPAVRWVGPYHPAYRFDHDLMGAYYGRNGQPASSPPPLDAPRSRYNIQIAAEGAMSRNAVHEFIERLDGRINEWTTHGYRLSASLTPTQLGHLLTCDEVIYIDAWSAPDTDDVLARATSGAVYLQTAPRNFFGVGVRGEVMDKTINPTHEQFSVGGASTVILHKPLPLDPPTPDDDWKSHGTSTFCNIFGDGDPAVACQAANGTIRGLMPGAGTGGIFASWRSLLSSTPPGQFSRYTMTAELVGYTCFGTECYQDPQDPVNLEAVFQSNSWGSNESYNYTTMSAELDDIVWKMDILVCQSQGNLGVHGECDPDCQQSCPDCDPQCMAIECSSSFYDCAPDDPHFGSRPEAWSKNVVSVGGVQHKQTLSTVSDEWRTQSGFGISNFTGDPCASQPIGTYCASSQGPAKDGRTKPDLAHYFDYVSTASWSASSTGNNVYTDHFSGTSSATPLTAGTFGLLFEMWHRGVFPGHGGGASVFASRPRFTTAKALIINTARRYEWNPAHIYSLQPDQDITRVRQGWGVPNLEDLYARADKTIIINEDVDLSTEGQYFEINVNRYDANTDLLITLVYADPMGTVCAPTAVINDLNLLVYPPPGAQAPTCPGDPPPVAIPAVYLGNLGITCAPTLKNPECWADNWSDLASCDSTSDPVNTVENVFIQHPVQAGTWTIRVELANLVQDGNPETGSTDVDFALVISGVQTALSVVPPNPDWNKDGSLDGSDVTNFVNAFLEGHADYNNDGITRSDDVYLFLTDFLAIKE